MTDPTTVNPQENDPKTEKPKGRAGMIREVKGLATAIFLALAGFGWNKIESCMDRDFNENVQRSGYVLLQGQINEMRHEINECVIGLEVWKRSKGDVAGDSDAVEEDQPSAASTDTASHPRHKGKRKAGRRPSSVTETVACIVEDVASEIEDEAPPPSFDDIIQHVKQKSAPLNMQQWQQEVQAVIPVEQAQEQSQDEDSQ